ncbi:hypothetical protein ACOKM5_35815 [Streptomyces sp. BH097]|uniref:hypothetical protein n=1 Tax=unclassified Streptomyces TaxID=2593676 RepID=UPI003BB69D0B
MTDPAWITLVQHVSFGVTATLTDDHHDEAQTLLLGSGFSTKHPEYDYALGTAQPALVQHALERLYTEVSSHYVVIDDVDLDRLPPIATTVANRAVHPDRSTRLSSTAAAGERILADWDAVSDSLCDGDGWPLDDRYDLRQQQRDAQMWAQFEPYLREGPPLLAHAEASLARFEPEDQVATRWPYRLRVLREALAGGALVQDEFECVSEALLPDHPAFQETWERAVALRNAEGWHYALTWLERADVLTEIAESERALAMHPGQLCAEQSLPHQRPEAARAWSPGALQHINAAIESSATRSATAQPFRRTDAPPRSR